MVAWKYGFAYPVSLVGFQENRAAQKVAMATQVSAKTEKRRAREMKTISQMVALYCAENHEAALRHTPAYCEELVCEECAALDHYATERTRSCRQMDTKTSCDECPYHCYKPEMRTRIKAVMRFSGPRMITKHPIAAIRHLLGA